MANIRDVARRAQVSPATVSRILNENQVYKTTGETRERVLRAVTELGYRPVIRKREESAPKEGDSVFSVGVLLATTGGKYSDPYYLSILSGLEEELPRQGGSITLVHTEQELEDSAILNRVLGAGLSGLILMRPLAPDLFHRLQSRIPHFVGIDTGVSVIDNVEYDHNLVSRIAVEYLYQKGHRKIGYIGGSVGNGPLKNSRRYRSYLETMADLQLPVHPEWVFNCAWDDRKCMEIIGEACRGSDFPSALYAGSDLMAMAALRALYQQGIRVPEEAAVIGMSNIEMSQYANPPLTTVDVPTREMGMEAARLIARRIRGDQMLPLRIILPSRLIERDSV